MKNNTYEDNPRELLDYFIINRHNPPILSEHQLSTKTTHKRQRQDHNASPFSCDQFLPVFPDFLFD